MEGYRKALELARQDYAAAQSRKAAIDAEIETIEKEMRQLRNLIETLTSLVGEPVDVAAKAPPPRPQRPAPSTATDDSGREAKVLHLLSIGPLSPSQMK